MVKIYIDTEFNGHGGELISMALVAASGEKFYEVVEFDGEVTTLVADHVIPVLYKPATSDNRFKDKLEEFLSQFSTVHIVSDWPDDISYFCKALLTKPGFRINTPPLTMEVTRVDTVSKVPHNALADAEALAEFFEGRRNGNVSDN